MKVLCGTDFSEPAKDAAEVASYVAAKLKHPLKLVHCVADWLAPAEYPVVESLHSHGQNLLDAEADRICAPGQRVETTVMHGSAGHHLIEEGDDDTALVVMGATGKGITERLLVGSVAEHVAESVITPTLVVRHAEPLLQWLQNGKALKVLCASDVSESEDALPRAIEKLLLLGPIDLECAHFVQMNAKMVQSGEWMVGDSDFTTPANKETTAVQEKVKKRFDEAIGVVPRAVHVLPSWGNPAYDLVAVAQRAKADLIVVGSHHRHGLQRLKHPSFSRRVLAHGHTNVLCVYLGEAELESKVSATSRKAGQKAGVPAGV
ncbi:nucleotide-binding universal stress UspA family protein [Roseimicrobium gellanilyticum]|uniref:Nucleotide-binding universal stress UspA family protein n=1 Tax=Roseimicrobium gellanilyticum TaxID=748857 RepID=A0A366HRZ8_9BACT|nr:universal stress protein [Roseimicrobium gellanilyticum]RBP46452.1 nucleotide-binding universal stress UspA family protein [Roseimicrobium gellanilyticum]